MSLLPALSRADYNVNTLTKDYSPHSKHQGINKCLF